MATQTRASGIGSGWTNSGNITALDTIYATASINNGQASPYLVASNFGFSLPVNSVINSISFKVIGKCAVEKMQDYSNDIGFVGGSYYTNKVDYYAWSSTDTEHTRTYTPTEWGWSGITASDINSSNFSYRTRMYNYVGSTQIMYVDYVEITVDYTPAGLTFVGGTTSSAVGSTSTNLTVSLTSLTGGSASAPAEGDIVIVSYATGSNTDRDLSPVTSGYTRHCNLYSNDSYDTNLWVATKIMGSTPDTSVVLPPSGSTADAMTVSVQVWRASSGNAISIYDIQTATGTNGGRPTPPAITPTRLTSIVVCAGAYALNSTTALTSSDLSNFVSVGGSDTNCSTLGMGSFAWTVGTFTPAQFGGGSTSTSASWCGFSLVIAERVATPLLNKDLIAYWKLDGNSKNETGIAYDGTDTDISYNSSYGKIGQGILCNGSSSSIVFKAINLPVTGFTISLWTKTLINHSGFTSIFNFVDATLYLNTISALGLSLKDSLGTTLINTSAGNINDGNMHHVVIQMNGSGVATQVYLDGKIHLTGTGATFTGNFDGIIPRIAGNFTSTYFNGYVDEVAIWNRALTGEEIQQLFYAGNGNTYPFQTNMADFM